MRWVCIRECTKFQLISNQRSLKKKLLGALGTCVYLHILGICFVPVLPQKRKEIQKLEPNPIHYRPALVLNQTVGTSASRGARVLGTSGAVLPVRSRVPERQGPPGEFRWVLLGEPRGLQPLGTRRSILMACSQGHAGPPTGRLPCVCCVPRRQQTVPLDSHPQTGVGGVYPPRGHLP